MINTELLSLEMYYSDQAQYREPCCLPARLPNNEGYEYPYTQQTIEPHLCIYHAVSPSIQCRHSRIRIPARDIMGT